MNCIKKQQTKLLKICLAFAMLVTILPGNLNNIFAKQTNNNNDLVIQLQRQEGDNTPEDLAKQGVEIQVVERADYSKVDNALKLIPEDLSVYTEESVKALEEVQKSVKYNYDFNKQSEVDEMATAIKEAVEGLKKKEEKPTNPEVNPEQKPTPNPENKPDSEQNAKKVKSSEKGYSKTIQTKDDGTATFKNIDQNKKYIITVTDVKGYEHVDPIIYPTNEKKQGDINIALKAKTLKIKGEITINDFDSNSKDQLDVKVNKKTDNVKIDIIDESGKYSYTYQGYQDKDYTINVNLNNYNGQEVNISKEDSCIDTYDVASITLNRRATKIKLVNDSNQGTFNVQNSEKVYTDKPEVASEEHQTSVQVTHGKEYIASIDPKDDYNLTEIKFNEEGIEEGITSNSDNDLVTFTFKIDNNQMKIISTENKYKSFNLEQVDNQFSIKYERVKEAETSNVALKVIDKQDDTKENPSIFKDGKDGKDGTLYINENSKAKLVNSENQIKIKYENDITFGGKDKEIKLDNNKKISKIKQIVRKTWLGGDWGEVLKVNYGTSTIEIPFTVKVDKVAPKIENVPEKVYTNGMTKMSIPYTISDDESGVEQIALYKVLEGEGNQPEEIPNIVFENASFDIEIDKLNKDVDNKPVDTTFKLVAKDKLGNENVKDINVIIDTVNPTIDTKVYYRDEESTATSDAVIYATEKVTLNITVSDNNGIAAVKVNNEIATFNEDNKQYSFELTNINGPVNIDVLDVAGNNISESDKTVYINQTYENNANIDLEMELDDSVDKSHKYVDDKKEDDKKVWFKDGREIKFNFTLDNSKANVELKNVVECSINNTKLNNIKLTKVEGKTYTLLVAPNELTSFPEGENKIHLTVTNLANKSTTKDFSFYIDTKEPESIDDVKYDGLSESKNKDSNYANKQVTLSFKAKDAGEKAHESSGIRCVSLSVGEQEIETLEDIEDIIFSFGDDKTERLFGKVIATITDNVGNVKEFPVTNNGTNEIMIENIKPTITPTIVTKDYKTADINDKTWYDRDIEYKFSFADADSGLNDYHASVTHGEKTKSGKADGAAINVNTNQVKINKDENGKYVFKADVTDNSGNKEEYKNTIYVDRTDPEIEYFKFENKEGTELGVETMPYGFYFKKDTKVTIKAKDENASAGIESITYYTEDIDTGKSAEITDYDVKDNEISFTIKASFKGQIFAKATDNVGHKPERFKTPYSTIIESPEKHEQENHIEFKKVDTKTKTATGQDLYNKDVNVNVTVKDTYSGIKKVQWSVVSDYDKENDQKGEAVIEHDYKKGDTSIKGDSWVVEEKDGVLFTKLSKNIKVKNNSNNIKLKVKMWDNAGNTSEDEISFSIDKTAPQIEVTYDNNDADQTYTNFYKADRKATVKVTERNFNAKDIVSKITNTDGYTPKFTKWVAHKNVENPDETYYTSTILYNRDGDYTFDISYKDLAANKANVIKQHKFTIDKTLPTVKVAYDNNSAMNGNYYKANRVATITIVEHNFDSRRVAVTGTANDNGKAVSFPATTKWVSKGDTHTATIAYTRDAKYSFDIDFNDKAGNKSADYRADSFYVDKTIPTLKLSGVANNSANKGTVIPVVSSSDTNFDNSKFKITLTGAKTGVNKLVGSKKAGAQSATFTFVNFPKKKNVDDIYTLQATVTDKAGNTKTEQIRFSVNRFGSIYTLGKDIKDMNDKYIKNEKDIIVTETNTDKLQDIKVTMFKDNQTKKLVKDKDFSITSTGGNGQWHQNTYRIFKENFKEDGIYKLTIHSKDAAGNIAENTLDTKNVEINFGIDKTAPTATFANVESNEVYPVDFMSVDLLTDDNLLLDNVKVYLDDYETVFKEWKAKEIKELIMKNDKLSFNITGNDKTAHKLKVVSTDAAGNQTEYEVKNFYVTTDLWVRFVNNKPLLISTIVGIIALAGFIVVMINKRKNKPTEAKA